MAEPCAGRLRAAAAPFLTFEGLLFAIAALLPLVPIWSVRWYVTQDGPSHVFNARVFHSLLLEGNTSPFAPFYAIRWQAVPSWVSHLAMWLIDLVAPWQVAEKVLLTLCMLATAAAGVALGRRTGECPAAVAVVPMAFAQNWFLAKGFHGFLMSMPAFVLALAWIVDAAQEKGLGRRAAALSAGGVFLYFLHPVTFAAAMACAASACFASAWARPAKERRSAFGRAAMLCAIAGGPAAALALAFVQAGPEGGRGAVFLPAMQRLRLLVDQPGLQAFWSQEALLAKWVAACAAGTVAGAVLLAARKGSAKDGNGPRRSLGFAAAALLALHLVAPDRVGEGLFFSARTAMIALMGAGLWGMARLSSFRIARRAACACFVAATAWGTVAHASAQKRLSADVGGLLEAVDALPPGSVFVVVPRWTTPQFAAANTRSFVHADALLALASGAITLDNYEARAGVFPVAYREEGLDVQGLVRRLGWNWRGEAGDPVPWPPHAERVVYWAAGAEATPPPHLQGSAFSERLVPERIGTKRGEPVVLRVAPPKDARSAAERQTMPAEAGGDQEGLE